MRILVVEDEKKIADFLGRGLQGAGYAVDVAPDGTTALQFTHDTDYDLAQSGEVEAEDRDSEVGQRPGDTGGREHVLAAREAVCEQRVRPGR